MSVIVNELIDCLKSIGYSFVDISKEGRIEILTNEGAYTGWNIVKDTIRFSWRSINIAFDLEHCNITVLSKKEVVVIHPDNNHVIVFNRL